MLNKFTYIVPKGEIITSDSKVEYLMIGNRLYKIHEKCKINVDRYLVRIVDDESKTILKERLDSLNKK